MGVNRQFTQYIKCNKTQRWKVSHFLDSKKCQFKQDSIVPDQICKDYKTVIPSGGEDVSRQAPVYFLVAEMEAGRTI